jgi:hypothetical protein
MLLSHFVLGAVRIILLDIGVALLESFLIPSTRMLQPHLTAMASVGIELRDDGDLPGVEVNASCHGVA